MILIIPSDEHSEPTTTKNISLTSGSGACISARSPIRVLILFCCCCCWFTARCRWCWINAINPSHWVRSTSRNKSVVCVHSFMKKKNSASTSQCYRRRHIHNFNYWNNFRKVATTKEKHSNRSDRPDNSRQCFTQNPFVWISTIKLPNH